MDINRLYDKYLVKSHALYWGMILLWVGLFIISSFMIPIDMIQTVDASCSEQSVIINGINEYKYDYMYIYKNKSESVKKCAVTGIEHIDNQYTKIFFDEELSGIKFEGNIKIDFIVGKSNLFKIILGIDRKYMEKEYV